MSIMETQFAQGRLSGTPQKREPVSLFHLPDELLRQIIDKLDGRDLYTLSISCKRLQRLSLPPYLWRVGITTPLIFPLDHLVIVREQLSAPGVPLAFFAKTIRRFSCDINGPFHSTSSLLRLCSMVINIEGLEDLTLHVKNWFFKPVVDWDPVTDTCIHLLDVAVQRCACLKLSHTENDDRMWRKPLDFDLKAWRRLSKPQGPFKTLMRRLSVENSHPQVPETYPHHSYALKTLILQSNTFLLPPFTDWAFKTLNMVPITRLDLIDVVLSSRAHIWGYNHLIP